MTLNTWIMWAFRPHRSWHPHTSEALARQAARDMKSPVSHAQFNTAMQAAGFKVVRRSGNVIFWGARDTPEKREYVRRKYIGADDNVVHPLTKTTST